MKHSTITRFALPLPLAALAAAGALFAAAALGCASSGGGGAGAERTVYSEDFENYAGGWNPRGSASLEITRDAARSGARSLYVKGRAKTWNGAIRAFASFKPGQTYRVSAWAMYDDDSAASQGLSVSIQQNVEGQGETYSTIAAAKLPRGEWVYLEGEYTVPRSRYEMEVSVYFESSYKSDDAVTPADLFPFYIDDITVVRLPPAPPPKVETDIPALSGALPEIPLGAAISRSYLDSGNIHHGLLRHFNSLVFGNEMKQDALEPSEGRFNWAAADALVEYAAAAGKKVRGHVLVWHQQVPAWLFQGSSPESGGLATKEQLYARMERHIKEAVGRYKGKVYTWDVVNECLEEDGSLRNSKYLQIVRSHDYISQAFRWAHEADPDALLCLNDYNVEASGAKQDGLYNLAKTLLDEGVPISVIGLQSHINVSWPSAADLRNAIQRFASLGLKVQVTELDMSIYASGAEAKKKAGREVLVEQALKYRALFDVFREEARAGRLDMVTIWGIADDDTWLDNHPVPGRTDYPLFFGKDLRAKPAYWALIDPDKLPIQIKTTDAIFTERPPVDAEDPAWALVSPRLVTDKVGGEYGWFKALWTEDALHFLIRVKSEGDGKPDDGVTIFIDPSNQKIETRSDAAFTTVFPRAKALKADGESLLFLASVPFKGRKDAKAGVDLRISGAGGLHSWNDLDNTQDTSSINYGTLTLRTLPAVTYARRGAINLDSGGDGVDMKAWEKAVPVPINLKSSGDTEEGSRFRVLWDDKYLYVLVEAADRELNDQAAAVYEQDSAEVFIDQNNGKTALYEQDDAQYRVSFRNRVSFNGGDTERFRSRAMAAPGGYVVEAAIPFTAVKPAPGTLLGFDVQINNADASGKRTGIRNWADSSNMGYQDTSGYGLLVLTE